MPEFISLKSACNCGNEDCGVPVPTKMMLIVSSTNPLEEKELMDHLAEVIKEHGKTEERVQEVPLLGTNLFKARIEEALHEALLASEDDVMAGLAALLGGELPPRNPLAELEEKLVELRGRLEQKTVESEEISSEEIKELETAGGY